MKKQKQSLTEKEIDEIVVRQADVPSAWGKFTHAKAMSIVPISLSPTLIEKAKTIARRRRMKGYQSWMQHVIQERIKQETSGFGAASPVRKRKALAS